MKKSKKKNDIITLENSPAYNLKYPTRSETIEIHGEDGKELVLDFSTDKMKVSGTLELDKAAKIFFECVANQYLGLNDRIREQVIKKLIK